MKTSQLLLSPLPVAFLVSVVTWFCSTAMAQTSPTVQGSNVDQIYRRLRELELKLIGKSHDGDLVTLRVERLEEKVFGVKKSGEVRQRLDALLIASEGLPQENVAPDVKQSAGQEKAEGNSSLSMSTNSSALGVGSFLRGSGGSARTSGLGTIINGSNSFLGLERYQTDPGTGLLIDSFSGNLIDPSTGKVIGKKSSFSKSSLSPSSSTNSSSQTQHSSSDLNDRVGHLETTIFGKNYVNDSLPVRLSRLEQTVFPKEKASVDKSLSERIQRLTEFIPGDSNASSVKTTIDVPAPTRTSAYVPKIDLVTPNVPPPPEPKSEDKAKTIAESKDVDFGPYMAAMQRKIKSGWYPPKGEETRKVEVVFKVLSDGTVKDVRITKSSGHATADAMALKAVGDASPLPPLPDGAPKDVDIKFYFDYTVHASRAGSEDVGYGPYLERRLKNAWFPPKVIGEKQVAKVTFVVSKAGQMSKLRLLKSSGSASFDRSALKAAENASPFRPLPGYGDVGNSIDEVPMFVSFSYDGTVADNSSSDSPGKKITASTKDDRTLAESNPEIFDELKRSLGEFWNRKNTGIKRICELQFWTDSTDTEKVKVVKSSGDRNFDEQARRAVKVLLPISLPKSSYTLLRGKFDSNGSIEVCAEDEPDLGPYMATIQRTLKGNWHPPKGDETKRIEVVFKLLQDGTIEKPLITTASGVESADSAALAAVTKSSPLPALPANCPNDVDIKFTFDYNVFKSVPNDPGKFRKFPESPQSTAPPIGQLPETTSQTTKSNMLTQASTGDIKTLKDLCKEAKDPKTVINLATRILSKPGTNKSGVWLYKRMHAYFADGQKSLAFQDLDALVKLGLCLPDGAAYTEGQVFWNCRSTSDNHPIRDDHLYEGDGILRVGPETFKTIADISIAKAHGLAQQKRFVEAVEQILETEDFIWINYKQWLGEPLNANIATPIIWVQDFQSVMRAVIKLFDQNLMIIKVELPKGPYAKEWQKAMLSHVLGYCAFMETKLKHIHPDDFNDFTAETFEELRINCYQKIAAFQKALGSQTQAELYNRKAANLISTRARREAELQALRKKQAAEHEEWRRKNPNAPVEPSGF